MKNGRWWTGLVCWALGVCVLLSGCGAPAVKTSALTWGPEHLALTDVRTQRISPQWWTRYGDDTLQGLIRQALKEHPDLALAQARVNQAQAYTTVARSAALPGVDLGAQQSRQRYSQNGLFRGTPVAGKILSENNLQVSMGWTPDVWGEQRAALSAAVGAARAAQAEQALAEQALTAQILNTAVTLAGLLKQERIEDQALALRRLWRQLVAQRRSAGLDPHQELSDKESDVFTQEARQAALKEQIALTRNQLAALCAVSLQSVQSYQPRLEDFPDLELPRLLGADLLGRRPDVVAAKWRAQAAQDQVQVAQAQFYPSVHLGVFAGYDALSTQDLIQQANRQFGVLPALRLPLFEGGRLQGQLNERESQRLAAVANYNRTVLQAVRQAADAIEVEQALRAQLGLQQKASEQGEKIWHLTQEREQAGLVARTAVLSTQLRLHELKRVVAETETQQRATQIQLALALGGGWQEETSTATNPSQQSGH